MYIIFFRSLIRFFGVEMILRVGLTERDIVI